MDYKRAKQNRAGWFQGVKGFLRILFRPRRYVFLGDVPSGKSVVFSNHVAASGPVFHELYCPFKMRFWGTYEMTEDIQTSYKYLSDNYLHVKKRWPLFLSRIIGFIIVPFVKIVYNGMKLIPTYTDIKFFNTVKKSEQSLDRGEVLIVFPEDSHDGYHDHLKNYFGGGFFAADKYGLKHDCDFMMYNCYYVKKHRAFIVDKGIPLSELKEKYGKDYQAMARAFCDRANEIGDTYRKMSRKEIWPKK